MWNPLSWAMECAAIIALALLDLADFGVIIALLLCNATISYIEEAKADDSIKALTASLAPRAKVLRDGSIGQIDAKGLVPGDFIQCRIGDIVPADAKVLGNPEETDHPLLLDQAAMTGESLPVKKYPGNVVLSGTTVKQGEEMCLVYGTGAETFLGRAATLMSEDNSTAHIQKVMTRIGAVCLTTIGIWVAIELAVQFAFYHHRCIGGMSGCPTLTNILVIIVGGVPIAMPTVLTVTLALGAAKLAKEGAIVARMSAVEEMAGMDILCSDKTGTLTLNELSLDSETTVVTSKNHTREEVMVLAQLSAQQRSEEAIDSVLTKMTPECELWKGKEQIKFVPFNPNDKFTVCHIKDSEADRTFRLMKGAPQAVLRKSANKTEVEKTVNSATDDFANRGLRALGLAISPSMEGDRDWEFIGLLSLFDPPRADTKQTVEECQRKGISVKMVTGDHLLIGKEVARQLGMGPHMYTTDILLRARDGKADLEELFADIPGVYDVDSLVEHADGFAEVFPEHKHAIVDILMKKGHMCGMTGDGVNDAPALKKADVGIAVQGATDAARGAADIVLTEPGLSTIVTAIIRSRKIFQRMNTYAKYTVAMTFRVCLTLGLLTVVYDWYFPTLLTVALAVFNDGAMIALAKDKVTPSQLPNSWKLKNIFLSGLVYGTYLSLSSWFLWYLSAKTSKLSSHFHLPNLENRLGVMESWCTNFINDRSGPGQTFEGFTPESTAASFGRVNRWYGYSFGGPDQFNPSLLWQCVGEQKWMRESMLRSLIYLHVSISGQALVLIVRTQRWSFLSCAGRFTYLAFFLAQALSTIIAIFGFNGYDTPSEHVKGCEFCRLSDGGRNLFFATLNAPQSRSLNGEYPLFSEAVHTDSIVGCLWGWAIVAWVWSLIWHVPLDLVKFAVLYCLNEDGYRDRCCCDDPETSSSQAPDAAAPELLMTRNEGGPAKRPSLGKRSVQMACAKDCNGGACLPENNVESAHHVNKGGLDYVTGATEPTWRNPAGRVSISFDPMALQRASLVDKRRFSDRLPDEIPRQ